MRLRPIPRALGAAVCVLAAGCAGGIVLHLRVPRPAEIPARAYPVVYVAASDDGASADAAAAIARHLESGATRVVSVPASSLLASARAEPAATLALLITASVGEREDTGMSVPTARCAPGAPCFGYPERLPLDVAFQVARVAVRAFDPRSGSELGHASVEEEEREPTPLAAQLTALSRARDAALGLFDVRDEPLEIELDDPRDERGRAALEEARAGRVRAARRAIEARLADAIPEERARAALTFDLGQLVRVDVDAHAADPVAEETARLDAAEAHIVAALRMVPDARYERALQQLRAERTAREDVRAQQAAADANFGATP